MEPKRRYTKTQVSPAQLAAWQKRFFKAAGPGLRTMCDMFETLPNVALTVKDAEGRIMYTNPYNARISGWRSPADQLGYTSWELYPPDQAAVYGGRDREVFETGEPIVSRIYGFVADRSSALNCVTVRPVLGTDGRRIGTATVYYRAKEKMQAANWYGPIRQALAFLNDHIAENVPVAKLASIAHFSETQFRRLFERLTGMPPSQYVQHTRINLAKTLLATSDASIMDVALQCGFYDHAHFIRAFKSALGVTPARFRRGALAVPSAATDGRKRVDKFTGC